MKTPKMLQRGIILWRHHSDAPDDTDQAAAALPELCPAARCSRCGYEFVPYTVSAVCPRCLEPFTRDPCYGGCFSCPLLPESARQPK
ncbi:MAG: hypothetical protein JSV86_17950 [Gemmatimonadota bacterium]|nr:MAG: hypothetical protein JSV86_17950 [Gemmatimonadota bacterium]